ncbi:hypothetical protein [Pseudomonas sp. MH9.3]|uniref:hypothetical protein n=1 Tax=Pseudomonas sp. MH9.3 TaxID=3048630 RepID=UPI002AC90DE1|nr:hypothetical protein [Pseudomonas sp. MH9.3]MEB0106620.1 hypothetical protein [Pseudomonas sp. MH9.3]WPX81286.1 hypothetical protein RHM60_09320 [Pseudomonas sp. MH9.3]WQG57029.1 hypothetical protein RHM66_17385 [Pseudomonas sp. RTB3]
MNEVKRWKLKGFIPGVDGVSKAIFQPVVVLADEFDAALVRETDLRDALREAEVLSESRGRQSSAFENRMGELQVENGKLSDRLATADERANLLARDAARYRWLRERDLNSICAGGVFVGRTPQNIVLNGEDLDQAIDAKLAEGE